MKPLDIAIVGGSLGGLFVAILLRQDGHRVRVFERSTHGLEGRGAGLVAQADVFAMLRAIGGEAAAEVGVVAQERIFFDRSGAIAHRQATPQMQMSWDNLFRVVRGGLGDDAYLQGRTVTNAATRADAAVLTFDDGSTEAADIIIGADGIGSIVRRAVVGGAAANLYAGYVAWRGLVPENTLPAEAAILLDRFAFYIAPQSHALGYSVTGPYGEMARGERRYNWVWYRRVAGDALPGLLTDRSGHTHPFSLAPGQTPDAVAAQLRSDAAALLPPAFAAAVAAEPHPFVQAIFDYEAPRMATGRLALLGDAAFVARPHTAMGVAKAAADAMALRDALRGGSVDAALNGYERARMAEGAAIVAYGRRLGAELG
ncbi:FAD binding domain-containing protein [Neoroseomonas lacus]|uniref:2-polyprenyl-6-methoxyphenol hydroxylase n=1 Tax=Neoroseomonas lacus TaxID=287609 RepID=A0A917NQ13_9PROT|nr:FAD-dependent monooxygenase [Neoroseomonas lacus]GGJ17376.1 2-polyprenyl-6-methoxyphenol hydroxylase [Neoroseomonas lacus]